MFAVEFGPGVAVEWHREGDGVRTERRSYHPAFRVDAPAPALDLVRERLAAHPAAVGVDEAPVRPSLDAEPTPMPRVEVRSPAAVRSLARRVRRWATEAAAPGRVRLFDVDTAPGLRYCVDAGRAPTPAEPLRTLRLSTTERALAAADASAVALDGDPVPGDERATLAAVAGALAERDPDVLVASHGDLLPLLAGRAADLGVPFRWGRTTGGDAPGDADALGDAAVPTAGPADGDWERRADASSHESYGRTRYSPARYGVRGRVVVDESASVLWEVGGLPGLLDLVERSWRPLAEVAPASVGTVFTAMQVREAAARNVAVPWRAWGAESFKSVATLHAADRGGTTFDPEVGLHEDVHEVDFASLYPAVICEWNVSPETVRHDPDAAVGHDGEGGAGGDGNGDGDGAGDGAANHVPGLDYVVDDEPGFLPAVLEPLVTDRAAYKRRAREAAAAGDEATADRLRSRADALKWVLVSAFGYQGYRNAKFGRIECHEAVNAVARDVLLTAKERLEAGGWRVLHGVVDGLWVTPRADVDAADREPLDAVVAAVSGATDVRLEREARYDWVCFVPRRGERAGALTRYFGRVADADGGGFKLRGIEARRRSTPTFVAAVQRDLLRTLDATRDPAAVVDRLDRHRRRLDAGAVDPAALVVDRRPSNAREEYDRDTLAAAALDRAADRGREHVPGRTVRFVVVDAEARGRARVRLPHEVTAGDDAGDDGTGARDGRPPYDPAYYGDALVRACESVVSPLGWDRARVERRLSDGRDASLGAY